MFFSFVQFLREAGTLLLFVLSLFLARSLRSLLVSSNTNALRPISDR